MKNLGSKAEENGSRPILPTPIPTPFSGLHQKSAYDSDSDSVFCTSSEGDYDSEDSSEGASCSNFDSVFWASSKGPYDSDSDTSEN